MSRKYFTFRIYAGGYGESVEEAWKDAQENFNIHDEEQPKTYSFEEEENNVE